VTIADDITVADLERDPYPIYARLRREAPAAWVPSVGLYLVTRAPDVELVTTKPALFSAVVDGSPLDRSFGGPTLLTHDGEEHLRIGPVRLPLTVRQNVDAGFPHRPEPLGQLPLDEWFEAGREKVEGFSNTVVV